jgi:TonB family protein
MFHRILLPLFIAAQITALAPALRAEPGAKPKTAAKNPKGGNPSQLRAAYTPKVKAALAAQWAAALEPRMSEFSPGNVIVAFKVDADGKVTEFTVTANTSNEPFAKFCEQFVRDTKFETPPAGALTDGQLEIPFTFTIL